MVHNGREDFTFTGRSNSERLNDPRPVAARRFSKSSFRLAMSALRRNRLLVEMLLEDAVDGFELEAMMEG